MSLIAKATVDKNGRHTTVYVNPDGGGGRPLTAIPAPKAALPNLPEEMVYARRIVEESPYTETIMPVLMDLYEEYGTPSVGRTRAVFDRGDGHVIKLAVNDEGFIANAREVTTSNMDDAYTPVARSAFWDIDDNNSIVIAEKLVIAKLDYNAMPDWVMSVDGGQVGYNSAGELVAYDL